MSFQFSTPIAPVSLDEIKAHLRIDDDFEDQLLEHYILVATQQAEHIMQREVIFRNDKNALAKTVEEVPPTVKSFIFCYVGDLYSHRELSDESGLVVFWKHLLDPFIIYNDEDE